MLEEYRKLSKAYTQGEKRLYERRAPKVKNVLLNTEIRTSIPYCIKVINLFFYILYLFTCLGLIEFKTQI